MKIPQTGLSPRVRGNRFSDYRCAIRWGSIPARAGEPQATRRCQTRMWVYPRACGGTMCTLRSPDLSTGLSPRVRGNHNPLPARPTWTGSIPARAGEPPTLRRPTRELKVYPRACGGTCDHLSHLTPDPGLSPRVRGNLSRVQLHQGNAGSIPARAGEPTTAKAQGCISGVYPRACGGTDSQRRDDATNGGLSPRVRGNRRHQPRHHGRRGSIPARAGEPTRAGRRRPAPAVYPRACGGTTDLSASSGAEQGLSPRVRGNPCLPTGFLQILGSIPARAGEPALRPRRQPSPGVYPRACGGTLNPRGGVPVRKGLSPRVRGNPGSSK